MCDKRISGRKKINRIRRRQREIRKAMARDIDVQVSSDNTDETPTDPTDVAAREQMHSCGDYYRAPADEHTLLHPGTPLITDAEDAACDMELEVQGQADEHSLHDHESLTEEKQEGARSNTSESVEEEDARDECTKLKEWAIECNIPHKNLDKLLVILRRRLLPNLPKSSKTFLNTDSCRHEIRETENGQFVYFGLQRGLQACIIERLHPGNQIFLQINVDGMTLFKSSAQQFWPILCRVHCPQMDVYTPFIVGCYYGNVKPHDLADYFDDFIQEINSLQRDGIIFHARRFEVHLKCFICDGPARALIKNIKFHGSYSACERCIVAGQRIRKNEGSCTVYPEINQDLKTNESFRNMDDAHHHNGISPLLDILPPIDIIKQFSLDKLHLFDGGAMKKLLDDWNTGDLRVRLGRRCRFEINRRITSIRSQIPCEFHRKPRSIHYVAKWKCTEFRLFLLYIGPIIMKNVLKTELYQHFLLLHVAARILCCDNFALRYNQYAKTYLRKFFVVSKTSYGAHSQSLNNHNLIHVADDVKNMNCSLNCISAYPFESVLNRIKKSVRSAHLPLPQICRRMHEAQLIKMKRAIVPNEIEIIKTKISDVGIEEVMKVQYKSYILINKVPDNVVFLQDRSILQITKMTISARNPDMVQLGGNELKKKKPLYTYPSSSKYVQIWELYVRPSSMMRTCQIDSIHTKMMKFSLSLCPDGVERVDVMSLLHGK